VTTTADEDELTELVDADFNRIDLVGKGANGIPRFLIAKQDGESAGLLEPEFVRDLIAKAEPERTEEKVTMTGSPAAIAKLIHDAAQKPPAPELDEVAKALAEYEAVIKAKYSAEDKRKMLAAGTAIKNDNGDPSYPIGDKDDLSKAISAVGRGGTDHDRIRAYVIRRAKALGASSMIPDNWASDGSLKETVSKADGTELDAGIDGLDPTVPLAAPDGDAPGDPADPGSPAWEAIDAATAQKWCSILSRAQVALGVLSDRELIEAAVADPGDAENAWNLNDACIAIDYAIGVLAPFAVAEQSEADCGADAMAMIGKAMAGFDPAPLDVIEALAQVAKAGRVLSSANEKLIRTAGESLNKVLQSLPSAPMADDNVAKQKETAVAADQTETAGVPEAVAKDAAETAPEAAEAPADAVAKEDAVTPEAPAEPAVVAKDGQDALCAVYDCNGKLIGVVPPDQVTPVQGGAEPDDDSPEDSMDAPAPDPTDMTPAPAADAGTPADGVAKGEPEPAADADVAKGDDTDDVAKAEEPATTNDTTDAHEVLKGLIVDAVAAALDARAPEDIAKAADVSGLSDQVETLKAEVARIGEQPAAPKVFTNGAVPPPGTLRGQDRTPAGSQPVDVAKAREMKNTLYRGTAPEQNEVAREMQTMAIDALSAIHAGRR
jgi:hypothetical protein